ncbi:MAG TPA: alpha/beta fold hydrolase [Nevskiaceae bacterium]|nr:alpha/beta fold hydrolase [Nevskiaceae bacterium]
MSAAPAFRPAGGLGHPMLQSILATKRPAARLWRAQGVDLSASQQWRVLDTRDEAGAPVQLTAALNRQPAGARERLAVLIHGWEGSHESSYLYSMACALFGAGWSTLRLNLRDHAGSHALNREMFHSARMAEVIGAIQRVVEECTPSRLVVVGFSLGGNFALRVGLQGPAAGLRPDLAIGISPSVDPEATLRAIDAGPRLFHRYFLDKWHRTLDAKARAFPGVYDFTRQRQLRSFLELTRVFVEEHTPYPSLADYFAQYTLRAETLIQSPAPLALLTSRDDSVIPFEGFAGLSARGAVQAFQAVDRGGHCGFIENWRLQSWAEQQVLGWLAALR